jgi:hypothetical protein
MLSRAERERLLKISDSIDREVAGIETFSISMGDIQWLATKLLLADNELKRLYESVLKDVGRAILPRDPLSVKTEDGSKVVAIWDAVPQFYRCVFCDITSDDEVKALEHAKTHL